MAPPAESTGSSTLDAILSRLDRVRKVTARGWIAACPAHEDDTPSLSLTVGSEGQVLMLCRANCPTASVLAAVGLTLSDLFESSAAKRRLVATYDYRDPQRALLYQVCRYDPKDFRVRRPVAGGWSWSLGDTPRVPYRLPELIATAQGGQVLVVEGEKDADRLVALGLMATTNLGGAGKWRTDYNKWFRDRDVVVIPDNDTAGRRHADEIAQGLMGVVSAVRIVDLPGLPAKGDVSDWLNAGGTCERLIALTEAAPVPSLADASERPESEGSLTSTQRPVDDGLPDASLAETLDELVAHLTRFIHFNQPEHADAVALWAAHTHARLDCLAQSPVLAITSAVKQSGKTRLFDVLEHVVRGPWRITRPSEAVLFRKIDADHPTVLLDEIDAIFNDRAGNTEGIRALFNSGNRHGTKVPRAVAQGRGYGLVEFDVFCPKATAGIGGLPDTVLDRAIVIPMERRARHERVERLRDWQARALGIPLRDALAGHVGQMDDFAVDDVALPSQLDERAQDGWEPLFAIAGLAGGSWPVRARKAALWIFQARRPADDNLDLRLLLDCRHVLSEAGSDFIPTKDLCAGLVAIEDSPWDDVRGKPITAHNLAKILGRFSIRSRRHRPLGVGNPIHGYFRADFVDSWGRYLDEESGTTGTSDTAEAPTSSAAEGHVPDVPIVPDARPAGSLQQRNLRAAALEIFGDDIEWMPGLA